MIFQALEFYLQMVASRRCQESQFRGGRLPRVHCMSTYFFLNLIMRGYEGSIQRWNKDVDIFTFHMVLVPIHLQEHWCLAIIDFRNKVFILKSVSRTQDWTICECIHSKMEYYAGATVLWSNGRWEHASSVSPSQLYWYVSEPNNHAAN